MLLSETISERIYAYILNLSLSLSHKRDFLDEIMPEDIRFDSFQTERIETINNAIYNWAMSAATIARHVCDSSRLIVW